MRVELLQKLTVASSYIFEELTDEKDETELAREFWSYLRSHILDDMTKKIRVSEFVIDRIRNISEDDFLSKYKVNLSNIKKSKQQLEFVAGCVSMLLHYSSYGAKIIDWS